jgi:4'-phosphopantetheinyl transferase
MTDADHLSGSRRLSPPASAERALGMVDVWYGFTNPESMSITLQKACEILPESELEAATRFMSERDRCVFLFTRILVRCVLSSYTGHHPREWEFARSRYGKPEILKPADVSLVFNVAHTKGMVICAVTAQGKLGVDVENVTRTVNHEDIAAHFFSAAEASWLRDCPSRERTERFLKLWILKEAFIKADGRGLSLPLDSFTIAITPDGSATVSFGDAIEDDPANWSMRHFLLVNNYAVALALRLAGGGPIAVNLRGIRTIGL